ncbi:hypothetical protein [Gemella cuniculi]|uniref:hypothetical protein n=1 Tax=Gemella cuniculi TaxID=150240 RepID=UPI0004091BFC|nr:hypothetical protein [Gemella cuniculi]
MKKNILKKVDGIFLAVTLIFSTNISTINLVEAKGSKISPKISRPSSKPSGGKSSKPSSSNSSSKPSTKSSNSKSTTKNFTKNSKGSYNSNYNSYNNKNYKKDYTDYLNNNYRRSGFFSGNSITNLLLWHTLFHSSSHNRIHASEQQKELVDNVKDSKVPVYMLEIKTKDGETKYVSVTKEQYDKVKEGDNISLKNGNLEIKNSN